MFSIGERVEMASSDHKGTVEHADAEHVRVKWDDGQIGLLYYDRKMAPSAHRLVKLTPERSR